MQVLKILAYAVMAGIILTIIFVRAGELGGRTGGAQASDIINATADGFSGVIRAATGEPARRS